jgi:alpha-N-arabinofuranosidase
MTPSTDLLNADFEAPDPLSAWRTWIYHDGQAPVIRNDAREPHAGLQSLLIQATHPADVALGQVVALPPGSLWQVTGWVRTASLVARDHTDTGGTIHIQAPEGATLARSPSTFGTVDWKPIGTAFRVPATGRIKIVLFFIGYGKGTGSVWFDELRLASLESSGPEAIVIHNERVTRTPIDAKQGGQFIEPLCHLIPSLIAQQVANTSFEVDPPWNVAFKRETDRPNRPWYPDGAVHRAKYLYDTNGAFNGHRSLRIAITEPGVRAGISQDGFSLEANRAYRLRFHQRGTGNATLRATLHGGGGPASEPVSLPECRDAWQPAQATLRATRTLANATLTLDFAGPGTVWIDRVSLIGDDAVLGLWRPDAVQAVRQLAPGVIRFGGSALESYEWDQCLGSWDTRAPFVQTYWGGIEENYVGVEEFVQFGREVNAEPLICVRWTGKQPTDAAAEVEYFNGSADTPGGQRRARNGHPEPYRVKYWQIGNEVGGPQYDASVRAVAEAMRAIDPTIRVLSSFPSAETLRAGGGYLDYLCPHHYGCADLLAMAASFASLEAQIRQFAGERAVRIAVTEWNTTAGDWELGRASLQTLQNALDCSRYHHLMHRHADTVEIAIRSNLIDSFGSGVILTGPGWLYCAPTYYAQRLYARAAGSFPLRLTRRAGTSGPDLPWPLGEPDLSATLSPDGQVLRVYGVNSTASPLSLAARLTGFTSPPVRGTLHVLRDTQNAGTPEVLNSRDDPERISVTNRTLESVGGELTLRFAPFSLSVYELEW